MIGDLDSNSANLKPKGLTWLAFAYSYLNLPMGSRSRALKLGLTGWFLTLATACGQTPGDQSGKQPDLTPVEACEQAPCTTELGREMAMGKGTVRAYGILKADGGSQEIGVLISEAALQGLPQNCQVDKPSTGAKWLICQPAGADGKGKMNDTMVTTLEMPAAVAKTTGINKLDISWLPYGHAPEKVWDKPQFDIHFPFVLPTGGQNEKAFYMAPSKEQLPQGYMVLPGSGFHWDTEALKGHAHAADPAQSPEFAGGPFLGNFLYITYEGKAIGYEAYVSKALLDDKGTYRKILQTPEKSYGTDVAPGQLTITHVPAIKAFRVSLSEYKSIKEG